MPYAMTAPHPGGADVLTKVEIELPDLGAGEVLIRHTAVGLNFLDAYYRSGAYAWPVEKDLVVGSEAAGVIEKLGPGVTGWAVGDRVAYTVPTGAYASHRSISQDALVKVPNGVSDEDAASSLLKGLTAYYLLHESFKVKRGDRILFHAAAGGVGSIAGQWLSHLGATAIGTAGGAAKCDAARRSGFQYVIDYRSEDFVERVKLTTDGLGVDAVFDSVGADTYPGSLKCLKPFGTLICFGQSSGPIKNFAVSDLASGSFTVTRPVLFHYTRNRAWLEKAAAALFGMILSEKIERFAGETFPLDRVGEAHRKLERRETTGSVVLIP
ncbi:quinone oxidoreductase family protein [Mesorhizobium qingshengii]|uniref:NADPH2:quinone reductase n=1 Tax=Mesorhizobium qingshengii TaxID=1165689 RepID=A0A1G5Z9M8_9HYPH|nr:quinone oxidoreductase [Mesorhizobium qingshengii]SDA91306.1 NADPH2:quinone reductase [Mesorhizobium qingshengii]